MTPEPRLRIDPHTALRLWARAEQMKIERHQGIGQGKRRPGLTRMCKRAKRRAHRSGNHSVDAQVGPVFPLVRQNRRQSRKSGLGHAVCTPVGSRISRGRRA